MPRRVRGLAKSWWQQGRRSAHRCGDAGALAHGPSRLRLYGSPRVDRPGTVDECPSLPTLVVSSLGPTATWPACCGEHPLSDRAILSYPCRSFAHVFEGGGFGVGLAVNQL